MLTAVYPIISRVIFQTVVASVVITFLTCTSSLTIFDNCKVKNDECNKKAGLHCDTRISACYCKDRHQSWDPSRNICVFGFRGKCKSDAECFKGLVCSGPKEGCDLPQPEPDHGEEE